LLALANKFYVFLKCRLYKLGLW